MTRLMCSTERKEVEELKSKLFRAGIRSEILSNPIAHALGIVRLEIHIPEADFVDASRIHQEFLAARNNDWASNGAPRSSGNGRAGDEEVEVLVEPERLSPANLQLGPSNRGAEARAGRPGDASGDLTQAAVLLEKEIEEVLARDHQLAQQSAALQGQVKTLEESLAAAQGRLESQTRELKLQQAKVGELSKEIASRDGQLGTLAESLAQTRAALESERGLRQVTEQKLSEQVASRKSLEQQVDRFAELQAKLEGQYQQERGQIQAYLNTVNKLRGRLSQKRIED